MDKKRLFKIMAKADRNLIAGLSEEIKKNHDVVIIKPPSKTLAMIKMREPVKSSLFYIGEVIVSEAVVALDGIKGFAVTVGDDFGKVLNMAIIDAACNKGIFTGENILEALEKEQIKLERKENAMHLKTKVSFSSMDQQID